MAATVGDNSFTLRLAMDDPSLYGEASFILEEGGNPQELLEVVLDPHNEEEYEDIDETLYDDSKLPPIPDIEFSEPQDSDSMPWELSPTGKEAPDIEDIKSLRRMIHHLGRLTIEVQMLRVQEQEKSSCMAKELAEAEKAMRLAVEELVQIKHHWGLGV